MTVNLEEPMGQLGVRLEDATVLEAVTHHMGEHYAGDREQYWRCEYGLSAPGYALQAQLEQPLVA